MFRFPIHILQKSSSLQTLSFSASVYSWGRLLNISELLAITTDHERAIENTPVENTVFLRKLKICNFGALECFLSRILSPASCLDVRNLRGLAIDEYGDRLTQGEREVLRDAIHLCSNSLTSFKVNNIQGESTCEHLQKTV
jgi:hypothetical protein